MHAMQLSRRLKLAVFGALVVVGSVGAFRVWRGPVGATKEYGGALASRILPEFSSSDAARWVNGAPAPLASLRGEVVLIEAWAPS
jgi:hypothetical protein